MSNPMQECAVVSPFDRSPMISQDLGMQERLFTEGAQVQRNQVNRHNMLANHVNPVRTVQPNEVPHGSPHDLPKDIHGEVNPNFTNPRVSNKAKRITKKPSTQDEIVGLYTEG